MTVSFGILVLCLCLNIIVGELNNKFLFDQLSDQTKNLTSNVQFFDFHTNDLYLDYKLKYAIPIYKKLIRNIGVSFNFYWFVFILIYF